MKNFLVELVDDTLSAVLGTKDKNAPPSPNKKRKADEVVSSRDDIIRAFNEFIT